MGITETPVSIIIPVYNDAEGLEIILNGLIKQISSGFLSKIFVVDNDSTDATQDVEAGYSSKHSQVILEFEQTSSPPTRPTTLASATPTVTSSRSSTPA